MTKSPLDRLANLGEEVLGKASQNANVSRVLQSAMQMKERIDDLIVGKRALADLAVRDGEDWLADLTTDDLAKVLSLDAEPDEPDDPEEDDDDGA